MFLVMFEEWARTDTRAGKSERQKKAEKATLVVQSAFRQKKCYTVIISSHSYLK